MDSLVQNIPEALRNRIFLEDGELYASQELQGNTLLNSFVGLARRHGVVELNWVDAREFRERYTDFQGSLVNITTPLGDEREYAVKLIRQAFDEGASDIHLSDFGPYGLVQFRRLGLIKDHSQLPGAFIRRVIAAIYQSMAQSTDSTFSPTERQDGRIGNRDILPPSVHSLRIHTEPLECAEAEDGTGTFMSLRLLYDRTRACGSLEERVKMLGFDERDAIKFRFMSQRTGLNILSGPTGHGKSTLLKHIMEGQAEEYPEKSYMSIEDPPEYPMASVKQIRVSTRAVAENVFARGTAYMEAIAGAMRSDPDVIMIGEIRFPESAAAAIDAALTGHGVWATLHANNGFGVIRRMVSLLNAAHYADPLEYLCDPNVIAGLSYQRLLPLLCPHCKIPLTELFRLKREEQQKFIPIPVAKNLMSVLGDNLERVYVRGEGCPECNHLGIAGQTVAAEVIVTDQTMLAHLRQGLYDKAKSYWLNEQEGRTYVQRAIALIRDGFVDPHLAELRLGVPLNFDRVNDFLKPQKGV